jgi:hypothetical protein
VDPEAAVQAGSILEAFHRVPVLLERVSREERVEAV